MKILNTLHVVINLLISYWRYIVFCGGLILLIISTANMLFAIDKVHIITAIIALTMMCIAKK